MLLALLPLHSSLTPPIRLPPLLQDKLLDRAPGAAFGGYRGGRREAGLLAAACEAYAGGWLAGRVGGGVGGWVGGDSNERYFLSVGHCGATLTLLARNCVPMLPCVPAYSGGTKAAAFR